MLLAIGSLLTRPINIVGTIVLARLLDPYDFGIVALGMLLANSCYLFVDLGRGPAIIQTDMDSKRTLFPAFLITALCGSLLTALIILFAQPIAAALGDGRAYQAIRLLSLLVFLEAIITIPESLLRKGLHFAQLSMLSVVQESLNLIFSVILAY